MVEAQSAPVSTAALATATGLHENTVRGHLEHLMTDGYLTGSPAPARGRGRPAWHWRALSRDDSSAYAALAAVLADTLARTSADPVGDAHGAGIRWGRDLARESGSDAASARHAVTTVMREQGFAPDDTGEQITLRRCPLIEAAATHQSVVCAVHRGMVDGVVAAVGATETAELAPFTGPGECTLHLRAAS